jgi:hypothetical protein
MLARRQPALHRVAKALSNESEDDGLVAAADHPVLAVPEHGAGQDRALHVRAAALQIGDRVGVADADDVLLDDRPLVQFLRHVVRGGADQHAGRVRPASGAGV